MYQHLLLPTDGSALSANAVASGIRLARALGARVTGLHVIPELPESPLDAWVHGDAKSGPRLKALLDKQAQQYLAVIARAADAAGVRCACLHVAGRSPYEEILKTAAREGCDLIYMASHGKKGSSALVLGSETIKVLTHSTIPVLVHREGGAEPVARRTAAPRAQRGSPRK